MYDIVKKGLVTKANNKDQIFVTFTGESLAEVKLTKKNDQVIIELTQQIFQIMINKIMVLDLVVILNSISFY